MISANIKINIGRFVLALIALHFSYAYAQGNVSGTVISVRVDQDGKGMVVFDKPVNNSPGCINPAYKSALAFDASTAGGKAIMAMALTAKNTGQIIGAYGSGACSIYYGNNVEDWYYGNVN